MFSVLAFFKRRIFTWSNASSTPSAIAVLPQEILLQILQRLSFHDILKVRKTNRRIDAIFRQHSIHLVKRSCNIELYHVSTTNKLRLDLRFDDGKVRLRKKVWLKTPKGVSISITPGHAMSSIVINVNSEDLEVVAWLFDVPTFRLLSCSSFNFQLSYEDLERIAPHLPRNLALLNLGGPHGSSIRTKPLVNALTKLPHLQGLCLSSNSFEIDKELFMDDYIQKLYRFILHTPKWNQAICFDDDLLLQQNWCKASIDAITRVTVEGMNALLRQWSTGERKIGFLQIRFECNDFDPFATVLFDGILVEEEEGRFQFKRFLVFREKDSAMLGVTASRSLPNVVETTVFAL